MCHILITKKGLSLIIKGLPDEGRDGLKVIPTGEIEDHPINKSGSLVAKTVKLVNDDIQFGIYINPTADRMYGCTFHVNDEGETLSIPYWDLLNMVADRYSQMYSEISGEHVVPLSRILEQGSD